MQVRAPSVSQLEALPAPTHASLGTGLLGRPASWVRRDIAILGAAEVVVHVWGRLPGGVVYGVACLLLLNQQMARDVVWGPIGDRDRGQDVRGTSGFSPTPIFLLLGIVALMRIASLATGGFSTTWFGGFAFAALPGALALMRFSRLCGARPTRAWGDPSRRQALVAAAAVPLGLGAVLASEPRPALDWWDLSWQFWVIVFLFAASGVFDEIFYQAVLRPALGEVMGTSGVAASAFLYAVTHADVELGILLALVAANVVFSISVRRTGLIVGACTGRALLNVLVVMILPYWLPH
jgi:hypothetical protein